MVAGILTSAIAANLPERAKTARVWRRKQILRPPRSDEVAQWIFVLCGLILLSPLERAPGKKPLIIHDIDNQSARKSASRDVLASTAKVEELLDGLDKIGTRKEEGNRTEPQGKRAFVPETPSPESDGFEDRVCRKIGASLFRYKAFVPFIFFHDAEV